MNRTLVMGILNITPDSFADGGAYFEFEAAITRAKEMIAEGVDIIDIGGESTRPGAERTTFEEERDRVIPIITELQPLGVTLSIDTTRAEIARAAIAAGATIVNDVSGGLADPDMAKVIAANPQIQYIVMHWRGHSKDMQDLATYDDVVKDVKEELDTRITELIEAGVAPEQIVIDPGIGFSKTAEQNWEILRGLDRFALLGYPILLGVSRKRFLGALVAGKEPSDREFATIALTTYFAEREIWGVRTHSVKPHVDAIRTVMELKA